MASGKKILIIDDDEKLNALLSEYLDRFNFQVLTSYSPEEGLQKLKSQKPDLIILDIMLPGKNGFEVCREIRKDNIVPIIMLTARGETSDRIVGLELGADDYLPKPFEPRELVARIQSVLRRGEIHNSGGLFRTGDIIIDFEKQNVLLNNSPIELTTMEFEILSLFLKNPGKVLTRERIMDAIKGIDWEAFDRSIDVLISRLRQKLNDDPKNPGYIKTIWGSGYKYIGDRIEQI